MEMNLDWTQYQRFFEPRANRMLESGTSAQKTYVICDGDRVLTAIRDRVEYSDWCGLELTDLQKEFKEKDVVYLQKDRLDRSLFDLLGETHFGEQLSKLRNQTLHTRDYRLVPRPHFLVQAVSSRLWMRVLPSSYAIWIRLTDVSQDLVVVVRKGKIDQFFTPEMHYLKVERQVNPDEWAKALSERLVMPVQGMLLDEAIWNELSTSPNPFRKAISLYFKKKLRLTPVQGGVLFLVFLRGYLGL